MLRPSSQAAPVPKAPKVIPNLCAIASAFALLAASHGAAGQPPPFLEGLQPPDAWETRLGPRPSQQTCRPIAPDAIQPVAATHWAEAVLRLRAAEIVPLTRQEAAILSMPRPDPGPLQPYLVRAVTKNETAGIYTAEICGVTLWITHRSLGHIEPPSARQPLVVFLQRAPSKLIVDWSMPR